MTTDLHGKTAVVTGAGAAEAGIGNGRAAAIRMAQAGARVALLDVSESVQTTHAMITERGGDSCVVECDVTDDDQAAPTTRAGPGS